MKRLRAYLALAVAVATVSYALARLVVDAVRRYQLRDYGDGDRP